MTKIQVVTILAVLEEVTDAYEGLLNSDYETLNNPNPGSKDESVIKARELLNKYAPILKGMKEN